MDGWMAALGEQWAILVPLSDRHCIRTPNFTPDGPDPPAETLVRTAVGRSSLARRKSRRPPSGYGCGPQGKPCGPSWRGRDGGLVVGVAVERGGASRARRRRTVPG